MREPVLIELAPETLSTPAFRFGGFGELAPSPDSDRETLIYSVYDRSDGDFWWDLYEEYRGCLKPVVSAMARSCADIECWTAVYAESDSDLAQVRDGYRVALDAGTWGRFHVRYHGRSGACLPESDEGGPMLVHIPDGADPQIHFVLLGHTPACHFYALPKDAHSERVMRCIFDDPGAYSRTLDDLPYSWVLLDDSCFQISIFGPDGDHFRVTYSPAFTRQQVRGILRESYDLPLYRVSLTPIEYDQWLDGHQGFWPDLDKSEQV